MVDELRTQKFLDSYVAHVNIRDIINLFRQIIDFVLLLLRDHTQSVTHITDDQTEDQKLRDPYVSVIVQHDIKAASVIHLAEAIACHCKKRRKDCLLLSVHDCKKQYIQQIEVNILKIFPSDRAVIQHKKWDKTDTVLNKRQKRRQKRARSVTDSLQKCARLAVDCHKEIGMLLYMLRKCDNLCLRLVENAHAKFLLITLIR